MTELDDVSLQGGGVGMQSEGSGKWGQEGEKANTRWYIAELVTAA